MTTKAQKAAAAAKRAAGKTTTTTTNDAPASAAAVTAPAVHDHKPAGTNTRTVVVVCKMPRGLYLQLHEKISQDQRVMGGGLEKRDVHMRVGDKVRLKPAVLPFGAIPNYPIVEGFSLTRDVPADFWRKWMEQNPKFDMLEAGLLRAFDTEPDAVAYCREYGKLQHGLEPLNPIKDPRVEASTNPNVSDVGIDSDAPAVAVRAA